jgi:hypothetical protein
MKISEIHNLAKIHFQTNKHMFEYKENEITYHAWRTGKFNIYHTILNGYLMKNTNLDENYLIRLKPYILLNLIK